MLWPQPTDDPEDPQNVSLHDDDRGLSKSLQNAAVDGLPQEPPAVNHYACCHSPRFRLRHRCVGMRAPHLGAVLTHCGSGIASIFALSIQYDTTTGVINNLTSKYVSCAFS